MGCAGSSSTQVISQFIWGASGSVTIKSIKLVLAYDPDSRSIIIKIPTERVTESLFSWRGRKCYLQDVSITDFILHKTYNCPDIKASFTISEYDQFKDLTELDQLVETIKNAQGKNIDSNQRNVLVKNLRKECKEFWDFAKDFWVKNKNTAEKTPMVHFNRECYSYTMEKIDEPSKIQEFLVKKYNATGFGKIKRDIKAKVIMERTDSRPHIVKSRKSICIQINVGNKPLLELQEDIRLMIFCWSDIPELSDPSLLETELERMQSGTRVVMSDMQKTIDSI